MKVAVHYRDGLSYLGISHRGIFHAWNRLRTAGALPLLFIFSWERHSGSEIPKLALTQADSKELQPVKTSRTFSSLKPTSKSFHPVPMGTSKYLPSPWTNPPQNSFLCTLFNMVWLAICQEVEAQNQRHEITWVGRNPCLSGNPHSKWVQLGQVAQGCVKQIHFPQPLLVHSVLQPRNHLGSPL